MGKHQKPFLNADGKMSKVCTSCQVAKELTEFNRYSTKDLRLRADCADCVNARSRAWREANPEKCRTFSRETKRVESLNPRKLLDSKTRAGIWSFLHGVGKSESTFLNLGYTGENLRLNLESSFVGLMTWENHGRFGWHVEHARPLASYAYTSASDPQYREAWGLENLRACWWHENLWKGARHVGANDNDSLNARGFRVVV